MLREGGVIKSTASLSLAERVLEIGHGLREVIAEFQPQVLAIEQVFSSAQFPRTAILMAHARAGDKGNVSNIGVFAFHAEDYPALAEFLTEELVANNFVAW